MEKMSLLHSAGSYHLIFRSMYVDIRCHCGFVVVCDADQDQIDENLIKCDDPKPPLYQDVPPVLADAAVLSAISHGLTSFKSPCPAATWDADAFKGRCAYIRTLNDQAVPFPVQNMMLEGTGQEWITKDVETGHSPQFAAPEKLCNIIVELAKQFETM